MKVDRPVRGTPILTLLLIFLFLPSAGALHQVPEDPRDPRQRNTQEEAYVLVNGVPEPKLGPNDVLHITVWKGLNVEETTVHVAQDGTITLLFGVNQNLEAGDCLQVT